jgi:hypothetical protein
VYKRFFVDGDSSFLLHPDNHREADPFGMTIQLVGNQREGRILMTFFIHLKKLMPVVKKCIAFWIIEIRYSYIGIM